MKRIASVLLRVLLVTVICLVGLILIAAAAVFLLPLAETVDGTEAPGSADWMAGLGDELPLSAVTLPGSHNCGTKYAALPFFSKCQSLSVGEQLEAGYRYLDVRLDGDDGALKLTHGFAECRPSAFSRRALSLADVLGDCYAFLRAHPTETVLFCAKQEHGDLPVADLQRMLRGEIGKNEDFWLLTGEMPLLGDARGKIVLLRRWEDEAGLGAESGIPFGWKDQGEVDAVPQDAEANFMPDFVLWVQDRYSYGVENKWEAFREGLTTGVGEDEAAVHFLSTKGTLAYGWPYHFARKLNKRLLAYDLPGDGPLGWIVVDFGSARLAEHIYKVNFPAREE